MSDIATNPDLPSLLIEIGTEEIPARFLTPALSDLRSIASSVFAEFRLGFQEISSYATPRRLSLIATGMPEVQADSIKEVFGPAKKAAFDDQGNPSKAAVGFAGSLGIQVSDLRIKAKGKGEYVVAVIEEKGRETRTVLPDAVRKIILSLRFPKSMRWANGSLSFARPMHWIAAVFAGETVALEIDGIRSSNMTRGHRFLSPAACQIRDISSYMSILDNSYVVLDQDRRKQLISEGISSLAAGASGIAVIDEDLLSTVNYLVEYPAPVLCSFSEEYLSLPEELLVTVMKDHQKYFAVRDAGGKLINRFVVVSNTRPENAETVRVGAERVIRARFDDAKFYVNEDRKKKLEDRVDELKRVTFHDELGSLFDKTERVVAVASFLSGKLAPGLREGIVRACRLAKTDLITGVVREFPELQGTMGKYYALRDGEDDRVAAALEEQYLPHSLGGRLPSTKTGAILSLADRADNIASFFSIGLMPTGSEDPFALRRQALGLAAILIDRGHDLSIREVFESALSYVPRTKAPRTEVLAQILSFMEQRLEFILTSRGCEQDIVKSVIALALGSPLKAVMGRIEALAAFRRKSVYPDFLLAIKRVNNITPKTPLPPVREALFVQEEEMTLFGEFRTRRSEIELLLASEKFTEALDALSGLTSPINAFFDKVLVMDKNEEVKSNRLSLLKDVWSSAAAVCDFSKLL